MRLLHLVAGALLLTCPLAANNITEEDRQNFIDTYAAIAITEMKFSEIPASITLAQAILESNWGYSTIAENANNFFCIKCFNGWDGDSFDAKDDEPGLSCFRKYSSVWQSFRDHSEFLKNGRRYQPLFELDKTDFRGWANGLKECGYATDSAYGEKLIGLIEDYGLWVYDYAVPMEFFTAIEEPEMKQETEIKPEIQQLPLPVPERELLVEQPIVAETKIVDRLDPMLAVPMYNIEDQNRPFEVVATKRQSPMRPNGVRKMKIRPIMPLPTMNMTWD